MGGFGLHVNANKTNYMCSKYEGGITTQSGGTLIFVNISCTSATVINELKMMGDMPSESLESYPGHLLCEGPPTP